MGPPSRFRRVVVLIACVVGATVLILAHFDPGYATAPIARGRPSKAAVPTPQIPAQSASPSASTSHRAPGIARVSVVLGSVRLELLGLAWFMSAAVAVLVFSRERTASYLFFLSILGLAGTFYSAHQAAFRLQLVAPYYRVAIACMAVVFVVSALSEQVPVWNAIVNLPRELVLACRRPLPWALIAIYVGVCLQPSASAARPDSLPTLASFGSWYARQDRVALPARGLDVAVRVVVFRDYLCAPCRVAHDRCDGIVRAYAARYPGAVRLEQMDFPLSSRCNSHVETDLHPLACQAAQAVRAARSLGTQNEFESWLWSHQRTLSEFELQDHTKEVGVTMSPAAMVEVQEDIEVGHRAGVTGTPTYFVNGVRMPVPDKDLLEGAIKYELRAAGIQE